MYPSNLSAPFLVNLIFTELCILLEFQIQSPEVSKKAESVVIRTACKALLSLFATALVSTVEELVTVSYTHLRAHET